MRQNCPFSIEEIKKFEFDDVQIEDFTPYLLEKEKEFFKKGYQNECLCPLSIEKIENTLNKTASISPYSRKEIILDKSQQMFSRTMKGKKD